MEDVCERLNKVSVILSRFEDVLRRSRHDFAIAENEMHDMIRELRRNNFIDKRMENLLHRTLYKSSKEFSELEPAIEKLNELLWKKMKEYKCPRY